jgi:predicted nucleotidyltransferase
MKQIVDEIARKLRDALKETIDGFEGLYVYGSQVRGDATQDSDIDIMVLFTNAADKKSPAYYRVVSQIMYDYYGNDLDLHRRTREELERNYRYYDEVVNKGVFYAT